MADGGYITFVQGDFDETAYSFQVEDHDTDVVKLKTEATTTDYSQLESVEGQWKLLTSIGVTIKNISDEDPLQQLLDNSNIIENNYRTIQGYLEDFECVKLEYGANCGMDITSITPMAAADVGEMSENGISGIVEIIGDSFLDDEAVIGDCIKPDDHHVKFRTIDNNWIAPLEGDYLEYTNTTIRVKVPTVGYKDNSQDLYDINSDDINDAVACTGEVRGAGTRGATAFNFKNCGAEPNVNFSQSHEGFLMSFNSDIDWQTGTAMPNLNWNNPNMGTLQADMESTALHELGHAHLLLHTCNADNVMFRPGPGQSSTDEYRRALSADDENGGSHISMLSNSQAAPSCDGSSMILIDLGNCDVTPVVEINGNSYEFSVFPNPTSSLVFVRLKENPQTLRGHLSIYNGQGLLVEHGHLRAGEATFNTSSFPSGIYYIQFTSETKSSFFISKFIKE